MGEGSRKALGAWFRGGREGDGAEAGVEKFVGASRRFRGLRRARAFGGDGEQV